MVLNLEKNPQTKSRHTGRGRMVLPLLRKGYLILPNWELHPGQKHSVLKECTFPNAVSNKNSFQMVFKNFLVLSLGHTYKRSVLFNHKNCGTPCGYLPESPFDILSEPRRRERSRKQARSRRWMAKVPATWPRDNPHLQMCRG